MEREIDVIEEIARLHGYDKFESTLPAYSGAVIELPRRQNRCDLRARALALGYNEAVSLTFISHEDAEKFATVAAQSAGAGESAERRSLRDAHLAGARTCSICWHGI